MGRGESKILEGGCRGDWEKGIWGRYRLLWGKEMEMQGTEPRGEEARGEERMGQQNGTEFGCPVICCQGRLREARGPLAFPGRRGGPGGRRPVPRQELITIKRWQPLGGEVFYN